MLLYESHVRRQVLESEYHMHMLSLPQLVWAVSIRQLGMHMPVSACHIHSSSPSQPTFSVQRNWQILAQLDFGGRHVHMVWAEQSLAVSISVQVLRHSGTLESHMQRDVASQGV